MFSTPLMVSVAPLSVSVLPAPSTLTVPLSVSVPAKLRLSSVVSVPSTCSVPVPAPKLEPAAIVSVPAPTSSVDTMFSTPLMVSVAPLSVSVLPAPRR